MTETFPLELAELRYSVRNHWTYALNELLHGITLTLEPGESFGFLGHNGAGKTTTIKTILGLLKPTSGSVKLFGKSNALPASRASVGYLAEQPYFYDYLTVTETLELFADLAGVPVSARKAEISRVLELVKITGRAKSAMRSLSKGLTQRVGMAQALLGKPKLLILDEPFSGLDPIGRRELRDLLVQQREEGTTIFMSSHILSDVEFLCDRVSILSHGTLKGVFRVDEIPRLSGGSYELVIGKTEAASAFANSAGAAVKDEAHLLRLSFKERKAAELALAGAIQSQIHVESFNFEQGGLEELFVKLVQFDEGGSTESSRQGSAFGRGPHA